MGSSSGGYRIQQYKRWASLRRDTGFRSRFEADINANLPEGCARYEAARIPYKVVVLRSYTPDWLLPAQAIVLEAKGRFTKADRDKMLLVKTQYPDLDIRMVFMSLTAKVTKGMTTADWCGLHGFPCCKGPAIPAAWLEHKPGKEAKAAFKAFAAYL
ncbi:MAG: endonuclease [Desulfovibrio sp.]|uniref:endonuclease n=1 Tax=Desulfovibrio sp. TaxID=885 RepID=UPI00258BC9F8|nr:endonuclease [Desulfovibrio sp.]MCD7983749.1 endonuclease [Desulfovibrio sp.]